MPQSNFNMESYKFGDIIKYREKEYDWDQETRIATITVDMQRVFSPRKSLTADLIAAHWEYCNRQMDGRIRELLGEVGFGKES